VLVAVLALAVEAVLALVQRQIVSPGLSAGATRRSPIAEVVSADTGATADAPPSSSPELAGAKR
jgi:hypothetical protein